jgi:hypothetical protein
MKRRKKMRQSVGIRSMRLIAIWGLALFLLLMVITPAAAQGPMDASAIRQAPAPDCAVITKMAGFPQIKASSVVEDLILGNEGVVIRQSYIKDGKIVIPPQGLYYTVRTGGERQPLVNYPVLLLGKVVYLADNSHNYSKKTDFVVKKGEAVPYGGNFSALELSSTETSWPRTDLWGATFQVLKPSGNYYGSTWQVKGNPAGTRSSEDALAKKAWTESGSHFYQADLLASTGTVYLLAKEVKADQVTVAEWVANEIMTTDIATKAITATLAVGESFDLGQYKAKLTALDSNAKTAKVEILGADGKSVAEKTFGPLTDQVRLLLASDDTSIGKMLLHYQDVTVGVPGVANPFKDAGKVMLVGNTGIYRTTMGQPFPPDPRFIVFHDT